jgi:hypothetical protein
MLQQQLMRSTGQIATSWLHAAGHLEEQAAGGREIRCTGAASRRAGGYSRSRCVVLASLLAAPVLLQAIQKSKQQVDVKYGAQVQQQASGQDAAAAADA